MGRGFSDIATEEPSRLLKYLPVGRKKTVLLLMALANVLSNVGGNKIAMAFGGNGTIPPVMMRSPTRTVERSPPVGNNVVARLIDSRLML